MTTIGKEQRKFIDPWKTKLPGVGSYNLLDVEARKTKGGSFTRSVRAITEGSQTSHGARAKNIYMRPGPGSYSIDLKKKDKVVSFPHSRRFATDSGALLPGPGDYKTQECSKQKIKAGIICKSPRRTFYSSEKVPGPSDYYMPEVTSYKKKDPIALFGKAKRALHQQDSQKNLIERYNTTREGTFSKQSSFNIKKQLTTQRQSMKLERARHGKKIERQAKVVQQDQFEP